MTKKIIFIVAIIVIVIILLAPIPGKYVNGNIEYNAILYSIKKYNTYARNEFNKLTHKKGFSIKVLGFKIYDNVQEEQVGFITLNRNKSYLTDFEIINDKVKINCVLTIKNNSKYKIKFNIEAYSDEDYKNGLLKSNKLYVKDDEDKIHEYTIEPNEEITNLKVSFVGEHGNSNQKIDRNIPDIIKLIPVAQTSTSNFKTHPASTSTRRVGGLIPYNIKSDLILEIPEDYFQNLNSTMTYDELISEIGEPSGVVGSGIVREYWRIDEDRYAVCEFFGNFLHFDIWKGESY